MKWYGVGLGGAGGNIMDTTYGLMRENFIGVSVFNTAEPDKAKLSFLKERFFLFGDFGGAGVGSKWKDSRDAITQEKWKKVFVENVVSDGIAESQAVLLASSTGGGTGSGAIPVVSGYIKEILSSGGRIVQPMIAGVVLPFRYPKETMRFSYNTAICLANLLDKVDAILIADNDYLMERITQETPNISDVELLDKINVSIAEALRVLSSASETPIKGGFKTTFDSQDLKSSLSMFEAALVVPYYFRTRVDVLGGSLEFLVEAALEAGGLAKADPSTAIKAAFVVKGPETLVTVDNIFQAKRVLVERIAGVDVREGIAATPPDSKYIEIAVLLVEPKIDRIDEVAEQARVYYDLFEDDLTAKESTPREEFESYLKRLEDHMNRVDTKREQLVRVKGTMQSP